MPLIMEVRLSFTCGGRYYAAGGTGFGAILAKEIE